jgi:6-phosphogluconolactonase
MKLAGLDKALIGTMMAALMTHAHCAQDTDAAGVSACSGERIYIGTHEQDGRPSIFTSTFDDSTGMLDTARAVATIERPTWLVKDPVRPILYSVSETGNDGRSVGNVFSLQIDAGTGRLAEVNHVPSGGGGPTHLALDARSDTLFVANFGTGQAAALPIGGAGELGPPESIGKDYGTGPTRRQQGPHAHGVTIDPSRQFVLVPDLGADRVFVYRLGADGRQLAPAATPFLQLPPGSGPRHLVFGADGRMAYLLTELTGELRVYGWDARHGVLQPVQTLATVGADYQGQKSAGEIVVSADGQRVYVSSRGEDAIVTYSVDVRSGRLFEIQRTPSGGRQPWHLVLSPGGRWLLASNEASNSVNVFRVDGATGRLAATASSLNVTKPVDVVFAGACAAAR